MPQYSGVWSLQQQMQALTSGQWATDPLFDYTTLLLQGDAGANGAQNNVFYDTSPNQFAITRNGNTTQGTFSPFSLQPGAWSVYCSGSAYNPLFVNAGTACAFGTGDFTIEFFFFCAGATTDNQILFDQRPTATSGFYPTIYYNNTSQKVVFQTNSADRIVSDSTLVFNTWTHIVLSRVSSVTRLFINGVQQSSTYADTNTYVNGASRPILGHGFANNSAYPNGYYSNVRVLKGTGVTSVAVPNAPLTAITNTQLLICQSNYFVDNSSNAFAVSTSGTPSVQSFSPFAPQFQYTASGTGGSGYFDGNGDYLAATITAIGTSQFTYEAFVYPTTLTGYQTLFDSRSSNTDTTGFTLQITPTGTIEFASNGGIATTATITAGQWSHICVTRGAASAITVYINAVSRATGTNSNNLTKTSGSIGKTWDNYYFNGYISGARLVIGSANAPSGVPIAPPTAITNTSLLLNFTNAGIYDGTMKNILETVGNASVSTSVVKYGSGSMYFDGTGDSLVVKDTAAVTAIAAFRAGDFTVEMWVYPTANPSTYGAIPNVFGTSDGWGIHYMPASDPSNPSTIRFDTFVSTNYAAKNAVLLNQWTHIAVTRQGTALKFWVNGVQSGSTATVTESFNMTSATFSLGNSTTVSREFFGYIDDFRITKGIARYTQNFIPPSVALPRQ